MENRWVRYAVDEMKEEKALAKHETPNKDLRGALIVVPEGRELSDLSLETLRHFRYYTDVRGGCVLMDERTVILTGAGSLEELLEEAEEECGNVTGHMPDFSLLPADDGCTLLAMGDCTYTFRDEVIPEGVLAPALILRTECLSACEEEKPLAVVWFHGTEKDWPEA